MKKYITVLCLWMVVVCGCQGLGRTSQDVVVLPGCYLSLHDQVAGEHIDAAIADLRRCYELVHGRAIPEGPGQGRVQLAFEQLTDSVNAALDVPVGEADFHLDVRPDGVTIFATTQLGWANGIYTLMDRWGVRWILPGVFGECLPDASAVLTLPVGAKTIQMASSAQGLTVGSHKDWPEKKQWARRNRMGKLRHFTGRHFWLSVVDPKIYFDKVNHPETYHPEYFALIGGERVATQPCTTHPDVIKLFIEAARERFDRGSFYATFPIDPEDNIAFCQCARCRALDPKVPMDDGQMCMTNRVATLANAVAAALEDDYPDRKIAFYSYWTHTRAPEGMALHPNVSVSVCRSNACKLHLLPNDRCPTCSKWWDILASWQAVCSDIRTYEYVPISWIGKLPCPLYLEHSASLAEQFRRGVVGSYSDNGRWTGGGFAGTRTNFPLFYMEMRTKADASMSPEAMLADMCEKFFGPAALAMERHHLVLAGVTDKYFPNRQRGVGATAWGYEALFDKEMIAQARAAMDRAKIDAVGAGIYQERVDYTEKGFIYLEDYLDGMWAAKEGRFDDFLAAFDRVDDDITVLADGDKDFKFCSADARYRMKAPKLKSQAKYFPDSLGFVRAWTLLGPFNNDTLDAHIDPDCFPKSLFTQAAAGKPVVLADGTEMPCLFYDSPEGLIDFEVAFDTGTNRFSWGYAAVKVTVPTARKARILLGTFYPYRLYLNSHQVHQRLGLNGDTPDRESVIVKLPAGTSTLVFKSSQTAPSSYSYRWGFYLRITGTDGNLMDDMTCSPNFD